MLEVDGRPEHRGRYLVSDKLNKNQSEDLRIIMDDIEHFLEARNPYYGYFAQVRDYYKAHPDRDFEVPIPFCECTDPYPE